MFSNKIEIVKSSTISDIVNADYRTAAVFSQYDMEYCCGAKWPLETVCMMKGIDVEKLIKELKKATRTITLSSLLPFENWSIDFLVDYLLNVHHYYIREMLPVLDRELDHFTGEHKNKYPQYEAVLLKFREVFGGMVHHINIEEETIFPYMRQVYHAHKQQDSLGRLLVKTLRKPLSLVLDHEHIKLANELTILRDLTGNYHPPHNACTGHKVIAYKLKELDHTLSNHLHLENEILFPRILAMETQLLTDK